MPDGSLCARWLAALSVEVGVKKAEPFPRNYMAWSSPEVLDGGS